MSETATATATADGLSHVIATAMDHGVDVDVIIDGILSVTRPERTNVSAADANCQLCPRLALVPDMALCQHGRPYAVWSAEERAYRRLSDWAAMVRAWPNGTGPKRFARDWDLTPRRREAHALGVTDLEGSDGTYGCVIIGHGIAREINRDPSRYAPRARARVGTRDARVKITFPDWATLTPCEGSES